MKCEGCMFQRYRMTEEGQAWYCRMESSDDVPIFHFESACDRECTCGFR